MTSDRQMVELTLAPMLLLDVVTNGPVDRKSPDVIAAQTHLVIATTEIVAGMTSSKRDKILRRSRRVFDQVTAPYRKPGAEVAKTGLIAFYWLQTLVSARYFVLAEDCALQKALDLILPALSDAASIPALDASAQKQARRLLNELQDLGYFREVSHV
jgi:hypothetical protein